MAWLITRLASVYTDDVWVADSSPVECACINAEEVLRGWRRCDAVRAG
jgi:hypothetical protein